MGITRQAGLWHDMTWRLPSTPRSDGKWGGLKGGRVGQQQSLRFEKLISQCSFQSGGKYVYDKEFAIDMAETVTE